MQRVRLVVAPGGPIIELSLEPDQIEFPGRWMKREEYPRINVELKHGPPVTSIVVKLLDTVLGLCGDRTFAILEERIGQILEFEGNSGLPGHVEAKSWMPLSEIARAWEALHRAGCERVELARAPPRSWAEERLIVSLNESPEDRRIWMLAPALFHKDPFVRDGAWWPAIQAGPEIIPAILSALERFDGSPECRALPEGESYLHERIADLLSWFGGRGVPHLISALSSRSPCIRRAAAEAIVRLEIIPEEARAALQRALKDDEVPEIRLTVERDLRCLDLER